MRRRRSNYFLRERRRGRTFSLLLHLFILLLCVLGLPSFLSSPPPEEPYAITVELVPVTGITNIKPAERPEAARQEKPAAEKKPAPPVQVAEETPPEENRVPLPEPKKKEQPKPKKKVEKKPEKKKPKPKAEDLAAVLKAVKETAEKEDKKTPEADNSSENKNISNQYNPELPMSLSEKDAIKSQIAACWNVPAGARDAQNLVVVIRIQLETDGSVTKVELAPGQDSRYSSESFFRAAADSAIRAVRECSPIKNLPPDKYATWRDMELTFDPKDMLL